MNLKKICLALGVIILAIILACCYPHPLLWLFFILLLIAFLPTIVFHINLVYLAYPYIRYKTKCYKEIKEEARNFLDRHFRLRIIGQEEYKNPVIFIVNHSINDIVTDICIMTIKTRNKIVKVSRGGFVAKLFNNIEHICINPDKKNRTEKLLKDIEKARNDNYSIIIFPEGQNCISKTYWTRLTPFRNGAFYIAKELNIPIVPIIITAGRYVNGLVTSGDIEIHYLDPIDPSNYNIEQLKNHSYKIMSDKLKSIDIY